MAHAEQFMNGVGPVFRTHPFPVSPEEVRSFRARPLPVNNQSFHMHNLIAAKYPSFTGFKAEPIHHMSPQTLAADRRAGGSSAASRGAGNLRSK